MKKITIHAKLIAHEEYVAAIVSDIPALIESIQAAEGCISVHVYRAVDEPNTFYFIQTWLDQTYWAKHYTSEPVKQFSQKFKGNFKESIISELDEIS